MEFPEGIDLNRVISELEKFVSSTKPTVSSNLHKNPTCGRAQAIELTERIRPILNTLYVDWRGENAQNKYFEFAVERDASMRLIARINSSKEINAILGDRDRSPKLSAGEMHSHVWSAASVQWSTGHRHEAVFAAAKAVNSLLQAKLNRRDLSDTKLVQEAFSENPPTVGKPRLRFPEIQDEQTRESTRQGLMQFGSGCFQAIRNPVGHLPNDELELSEQEALEQLAALSFFARKIDQAQVAIVE